MFPFRFLMEVFLLYVQNFYGYKAEVISQLDYSLWLPATDFYLLTGANAELCLEAFRHQVWAKQ